MSVQGDAHLMGRGFYRDTDERMARDPAFRAAVDLMMALALQHEFTPGELKQIAFCAAVEIEMRYPRPFRIHADGTVEPLPRKTP